MKERVVWTGIVIVLILGLFFVTQMSEYHRVIILSLVEEAVEVAKEASQQRDNCIRIIQETVGSIDL